MGLSYVKIDRENEVMHERNEWNSWKIQAYDTIIHRHQIRIRMRLVARWSLRDLLRAHFPQKRV